MEFIWTTERDVGGSRSRPMHFDKRVTTVVLTVPDQRNSKGLTFTDHPDEAGSRLEIEPQARIQSMAFQSKGLASIA